MNSLLANKPILLCLNIGDQLTTISCGHVVVEIIKFIAYQRLQIPYTYQWLKQVVNKKKSREDDGEEVKESLQSERHFRAASTALENLDFILKSLLQEINGPSIPEEVCIVLGATPVTCREVYRLLLPTVCHKPQCHSALIATDQKIKKIVFRSLVTSEKLNQVLFSTLPQTNIYVFIKKKAMDSQDGILCTDNFVFSTGYRIPRNAKVVVVDFRTENQENVLCCNEFQIFGDVAQQSANLEVESDENILEFNEIESNDKYKWYQSSYLMKGFKDCIVNGSSVTNLWLDP